MCAREISIREIYGPSPIRELLHDMREMNRRLEELIRDPLQVIGASWCEDDDPEVYRHDEDPNWL